MSLDQIRDLITQKIGLDFQIIGEKNLLRAINHRCLSYNNIDIPTYWQKLSVSPTEFQELIELLLVSETWFFRDSQPFEFLKEHSRSVWLNNLKYHRIRGLSLPCSTGEEPYSIAITLLEAGVSPYQLRIDGLDLSRKAIAKAKQGIYPKNSFRGQLNPNHRQYFDNILQGNQIKESIRQIVNFRQGNVLNLGQFSQNKYDFIFCRNLLIYLTPFAVNQVVTTLYQLLQPNGLLFVGASEMAQISGNKWQSVEKPFTFAYYKVSAPFPSKERHKESRSKTIANKRENLLNGSKKSLIEVKSPSNTPDINLEGVDIRLASARQLGDEGKVDEAIVMCKHYIKDNSMVSEAYALLGTLYEATNQRQQAEQWFNKALYLNPQCYEALVHLALLKEQRGDTAGGEILRRRIAKLNQ
ncbi:MAG: CheR family methyltransferase [Microcystaceae cyanobacterium]